MLKAGKRIFVLTFIVIAFVSASVASAAPAVSSTVSGYAGNWILDFEVTNTLGVANLDIYLWGVALPAGSISATPASWGVFAGSGYTVSSFGGSDIIYDYSWMFSWPNFSGLIHNGDTLGGFQVTVNTLSAPPSASWFAFANDWTNGVATYGGSDYFNTPKNPGFEGTIVYQAVPEPSSMLFFVAGLAGMALLRKRTAQ